VPILAAVGDRKSCRIAEAVERAVDDLGYLGKRPDRARTDAGVEKKLREILRPTFGGCRQIGMQAPRDDVFGPYIVMGGHHEMRQHGLSQEGLAPGSIDLGEMPLDPVRAELAKNIELPPAGRLRPPIV
jgi:hypothetical protein